MNKILLGSLAAGLVLGPLAVSAAASNSSEAKKTPVSASAAANPILSGKRQVVIKPIPGFESIVGITAKGRLDVMDLPPKYDMFTLHPVGGKYQIKTAKAGDGKKAACIGIKNNGIASLTAVATKCDAKRQGQLFTITRQAKKDNGRPTYAIKNGDAYLQYFPDSGLIAEELGDAPLMTTFSFVDNGPAPKLG